MVRTAFNAVWQYISSAPGTFIWLAILLITTVIIRHVSPATAHHILERRSTNLHYLEVSPVRVLITSAFWIGGSGWFAYFVLYNIFHVPAERWLGTARWVGVIVFAHVVATYLSQGVLYLAIRHGRAPEHARYTLDYGVSYALAGVMGVLTYRIARPWRYLYAAAIVIFYGVALFQTRDFTSVGHLCAVLLGLASYPLTIGRAGSWDPLDAVRRFRLRVRHAPSA